MSKAFVYGIVLSWFICYLGYYSPQLRQLFDCTMESFQMLLGYKVYQNYWRLSSYQHQVHLAVQEMYSVNESRAIRDNFGKFWRIKSGSGNKFPHELKGITVTNVSTFSTRVRVCLLKEVCKKHQVANPELSCFITNYLARHELKIRPRRGPMVTLSYSEVVTQMSQHLSRDFLVDLFKFSKINLPEKELVERFLVLTPDVQLTSASQSELSLISMDEQPVLNANTSSPLP